MPALSPRLEFRFLRGRVEPVAQTLVGAIRIRVPAARLGPLRAVAREVSLSLRVAPGIEAPLFLDVTPSALEDGSFWFELPDLLPGDERWFLLEIPFDHPTDLGLSRRRVAEVQLAWAPTAPGKGKRRTRLNADVELVNRILVDPPDPEVLRRYRLLTGRDA